MNDLSERELDRLAILGTAWAAVRFLHPGLGLRRVDWPACARALFDASPPLGDATSLRGALDELLAGLGDQATRFLDDDVEMSPASASQLLTMLGDGGAVIVARAARHRELDPTLPLELGQAIEHVQGTASTLVLDLRGAGWWFNRNLLALTNRLITAPLQLPALLTRIESGFLSSEQPEQSGGFYRGSVIQHGERVLPRDPVRRRVRLAALVDAQSGLGLRLACALQRARQGVIVFQGAHLGVGSSVRVAVAPEATLRVRAAEWLHADGTYGFAPDAIADRRAAEENLIRLAVAVAGADKGPPVLPPADVVNASTYEPLHGGDAELPGRADRLLALFELYGTVRYFEAYRSSSVSALDEELRRSLRAVLRAETSLAYAKALTMQISGLRDSHARIHSDALRQHVGDAYPAVLVRSVEAQTVVVATAAHSPLRVGDVVVSVDGTPVELRRRLVSDGLAHSSEQARVWAEDLDLLSGAPGSEVELRVEGREDEPVRVVRALRRPMAPRRGAVMETRGGALYVDLCRLQPSELAGFLHQMRCSCALVLDLRGYCQATVWALARALAAGEVDVALVERREIRTAGPATQSVQRTIIRLPTQPVPTSIGPIALLVDERTISRSEYACQLLLAASRQSFTVGSATNGTTGDLFHVTLPGGVSACLSGHAYMFPDGKRIQGVGIQPEVRVSVTHSGLSAGRDEVLDAALGEIAVRLARGP